LTITPFNAGHTLGGTIWKIRSPSSGTILYAVNMNHMKERHLDGTVLMRQSSVFEPLARPDLLITDAERANVITSRRRDRDEALIGNFYCMRILLELTSYRYRDCHPDVSVIATFSMRLKHTIA
jgi:Cft2 family RNA processing exonuclease